jgi:hypothetical protein
LRQITRITFCLFLLCHVESTHAQKYQLEVSANPLHIKLEKYIDSAKVDQYLLKFKNQNILNAYFECNLDSLIWGKNRVKAYFHFGNKYKLTAIDIKLDSQINAYNGLKNRYINSNYDSLVLFEISNQILEGLENTGHPFALIEAKNNLHEEGIETEIIISSGPSFTFDTCHIDGDKVIKKSFLEAYTGIKSGEPYNESLFKKAHSKLNQLPFLVSERIPQLVFIHGGKAKPYYYLKKRKSDQVNGIVGLAPTNSTPNASSNTIVLTGEFTISLNNLFKSAKVLNINWRSFKARSQELNAYFSYPYILKRPIGADVGVNLLKFDTLYTVFQRQVGLQYYTSGINGFKVFYKVNSTNLNSVDTGSIRVSKQFPTINAIDVKQYGLTATFNALDYKFNPRKGYVINALASVGSKEIIKDNQIAEIKFGNEQYTLYDSNQLKTTQYQYTIKIDKFFPIKERSTLKIGAYLSQIIAPRVYFNELQREGGINSLKGFNEQSIFASNFNMLEIEYRYLLGVNSNMLVFWNGAYYEDKSYGRQTQIFDRPWGFGVGGNIETGAGILTLIYALGKEKSNAFDIRTGKFHFGLSSYF